jgi:Ca2+-binding RTX toxin-like protein
MSMDIFLTEAELQTLSAMRDQARNHEIGYWQIDQWLFQALGGRGLATTNNQTMLWLAGATEANSNRGAMSMLIREFTATQYRLRYGKELAAGQLQAASDAVAEGMLADILGDSESIDGWPRGKIPDIDRIARADATAVGRVLFNTDPNDTAAELQSNAAWAGALLFTPLRSDQTGRLIGTGTPDTLDTLNDLRDVLYAAVSYAAALPAARSAFLAGSADQKGRDLLTMGSTFLTDYLQGPATVQDLWTTVLAGASGGAVGAAIERIAQATPNVFLDMLMGAVQGETLIGRTTDANFAARARAFFSALTPAQMQGLQVRMLPTAAAELAALARTDVNVRAALAALSTVSVQVSPEVAQRLSLVDPATGQGEISTQWIERRAEMLHWMNERRRLGIGAEGGVITGQPVAANAAYTDVASGSTVLVGAVLPSQRAQVYFGDAAANTFSGFGRNDYLFGGAGDDNLSGQGGDDYLEGNAGTDTLEGGEGADTLLGGSGEDRLDGGAGNDQFDGGAGADTYVVAADGGIDTLLTSDAADRLQLDGRLLTGSGTLRSSTGSLTTWVDESVAAAPLTYVYDSARGELSVSGSGSTVLVRDFVGGDLGIAVPDAPVPVPIPAPAQQIDFAAPNANQHYGEWSRGGQPAATFANVAAGIYRAEGGRGDDVLIGGSVLGAGEFTFGGTELVGRAGDDRLYAVAEQTEAQALAGTPALPPGASAVEGPVLDGGRGDDFIAGSASDDLAFGGAGDDRIVTGAGSDMVFGDGDLGPVFSTLAERGAAAGAMDGSNATGLDGGAMRWRGLTGVAQAAYSLRIVARAGHVIPDRFNNAGLAPGFGGIDPLDDIDLRGFAEDGLAPQALPPDNALYASLVQQNPDLEPGSFDLVLQGHTRRTGNGGFAYDPDEPDADVRLLDSFSTARHAGADVIYTGAGDDVVNAGGGNDIVDAGADQDVVAGYDGDDVLDGGSGDDLLFGDYLADPGGTGQGPIPQTDVLGLVRGRRGLDPSRHGNDRLDGGAGRDRLIGGGGSDLLFGGEGDDRLEGDERGLAAGWSGDDRLDGGAGNDALVGGARDDMLLGGAGDDVLVGDAEIGDPFAADAAAQGRDRLDGGEGNHPLYGGGRDDMLIGGAGDDQILGDDAADQLPGELHGNDQLDGGDGNDTLLGGGGDDRILGGAGDDWLAGEDQDDTTAASTLQGDDQLDGGAGDDTLVGGHGADALRGGSGDDLLFGGEGDDVLEGGTGLDGLKGGAGDDRYVIRAGDVLPVQLADGVQLAESIDDREGRNRLVLADGTAVTGLTDAGNGDLLLSLGAGRLVVRDALRGSLAAVESAAGTQSLADLARLHLDSTVALGSSAAGQALLGGRRADQLSTAHAGTRLDGGLGNDVYSVDAERGGLVFALREGDGVDRLEGWAALDRASGRAENVVELGPGIARDSVHLRAADNGQRLALAYGSAGDQAVFRYGTSGSDGTGTPLAPFDRVRLDDGSSLTLQELLQQGVHIAPAPFMQGTVLNDRFSGDAGSNTYAGGLGDDTYLFGRGDGHDTVSATGQGEADRETVEFRAGVTPADVLFVRHGTSLLVRIRGTADELAFGDAFGANPIAALRFADGTVLRQQDLVLASMAEQASTGDDTIWSVDGQGDQAVDAGDGNDSVHGGAGNDSLRGGAGDDSVDGGGGDDQVDGGAGQDLLRGEAGNDRLDGGDGDDLLAGDAGDDILRAGAGADALKAGDGNDTLEGGNGEDTLEGGSGADLLAGGAGNDIVAGEAGNDTLDGGLGNDMLDGGAGDDVYLVGADEGSDTIGNSSFGTPDTLRFKPGLRPEDVTLSANSTMQLTVTFKAHTGRVAVEYFSSTPAIGRIEFADGTVWSGAQIDTHVQRSTPGNDVLHGSGDNDNLNGGAGDDTVFGYGGDDRISWQGSDTIDAGDGNDTVVGPTNAFDAGAALITLGRGDDLLRFTNGTATLNLRPGDGADLVRGTPTALRFGAGVAAADLALEVVQVEGQDGLRLAYGPGGDVITMVAASPLPHDIALAFADGTGTTALALLDAAVQARTPSARGTAQDDVMGPLRYQDPGFVVRDAGLVYQGGAGNDTLRGGRGNDVYLLGRGDGSDAIEDQGGDASPDDVLRFGPGIAFADVTRFVSLADPFRLEVRVNTGEAAAGYGIERFEFADGSSRTAEQLNTVYESRQIDAASVEVAGGPYTLLAGMTSAVLRSAGRLTGNEAANILTGSLQGDWLDGGAGADTLAGGGGDDTYVVDQAGDRVVEDIFQGLDTVLAGITYVLPDNVEDLTLTGSTAINGTGNGLENRLTGNAAANLLDGGALGDTLVGGAGDDRYVVDDAADAVIEFTGEGVDSVQASLTWTLGDYLENLTLTGSTAIAGSGNSLDNVLTGNGGNNTLSGGAGNDTLDGGAGTDTMVGGAGNDTYVVERSADITTESLGGGTDTVLSSVTRTLGDNLENLTLTNSAVIAGTGNTLSNVLVGNTAANTLSGMGGNDTFDGGAGNDALTSNSTSSADVYRFGIGYGTDTITDTGGVDRVELGAGITQSQLVFRRNGSNLELTITGRTDKLIVANWYTAAANRIEQFRLADGSVVSPGLIPATAQASAAAMAVVEEDEAGPQAIAEGWFQHWQHGWMDAWAVPGGVAPVPPPAWVAPAGHISLDQQVQALVSAMATFGAPAGGAEPSLPVAHAQWPQWAVAVM